MTKLMIIKCKIIQLCTNKVLYKIMTMHVYNRNYNTNDVTTFE